MGRRSELTCPVEDWDLAITGIGFEELFLDLIEDEQCLNKADFFLRCLCLWVYDTLRVGRDTRELEPLLRRAEASKEAALRTWARRARDLIAEPQLADQDLWWDFGQQRSSPGS